MPRLCGACTHPLRRQIDADLLAHRETYRGIARRYGLEDDALRRHEHEHLRMSWQASKELQAHMNTERLVARIEQMDSAVDRVLARGESAGDDRLVLLAVKEARSNVETLNRIGVLSDVERRLAALESGGENDGDAGAD